MRHFRCAVVVLLLATGCASGQYKVTKGPPPELLRSMKAVVIPKVETQAWLNENPRIRENPMYASWRSEIEIAADQIAASTKKVLTDHYEVQPQAVDSSFTVQMQMIDFNPGSGDSLGEGKGRVTVRVALVDNKSKETFGSADATGAVSGGSLRKAFEECGARAAQFVVDHLPKRKGS